jgi:hypothetical protein
MAEVLNLAQRIHKVYKQVKTVVKDTEVAMGGGRSYDGVSHDSVTSLLHGPIAEAGIIILPTMESCQVFEFEVKKEYNGKESTSKNYRVEVKVTAKFINIDDPKDMIELSNYGYALDSGDKAVGKAYSMALKYIYLKAFMLESMDEEELRAEEREAAKMRAVQNNLNAPRNEAPVSQYEVKQFFDLTNKKGIALSRIKELLKVAYNLEDTKNLKHYQLAELMKVISSKSIEEAFLHYAKEPPSNN